MIMGQESEIVFWQRQDVPGMERLVLTISADRVLAESTVICVEDGGFRLDHQWTISPDWRVLSVEAEKWSASDHSRVTLERADSGWKVNGSRRPDLDDADEPDLSVTPFSNTFPIRRMMATNLDGHTLETCYLDAATMRVARSRQKYERLGPDLLRYIDLGLSIGFDADLQVDSRGLIVSYQNLFQRVTPG